MAHDRQVESNNELSEAKKPSKGRSAIVADWLMLYAQTYREEITEELALLYHEALSDLSSETLHKAFLRATRTCKFRPTPAEVRDAAQIESSLTHTGNRPKYLDEPPLSKEDREAAIAETQEVKRRVLGAR